MKKSATIVVLALMLFGGARGADAFCWVTSNPVAFGAYDVFTTTPTDSTGRLRIVCFFEPAATAVVAIGQSPTSGVFNPRQMGSASTDRLDYNLFTDTSYTLIWGDGTGGTSTVSRAIGGGFIRTTNIPVYGRIPPLQDVGVGTYSDSVTITVNW